MTIDSGSRHNTANGIRIVDKVLTERFSRPKVKFFSQMPYFGPSKQSYSQDAPILPLQVGHAPQP
jgi:hypothetical protein